MSTDPAALAEELFERARAAAGARDPREHLREQLRALKQRDPSAFRRASAYYAETLIPAVAAAGSDPLGEWLEYARLLAELAAPGRTVQIDPRGASVPYARPVAADALVLHLPDEAGLPAVFLGAPTSLSRPQRAAVDLLVLRRMTIRDGQD
jgi:hypothetical protein